MILSLKCILRRNVTIALGVLLFFFSASITAKAEFDAVKARKNFKTGKYKECIESSTEDRMRSLECRELVIKSLLALGRYKEAAEYTDTVLINYPVSISLLKLAHTVYTHNGQPDEAEKMLRLAYQIAASRGLMFMKSDDMVALGECMLLLGAEPKLILDDFYNEALKKDPNCIEAYLASGDLAIAKQDYDLAAKKYRKGLELFGDEPELHFGLARAFYHSDRREMIQSLNTALFINAKHTDALTLMAEHQVDCENYKQAAELLDEVLQTNPNHSDAWAYKAVLAHLDNDPNKENICRANSLKFWIHNPRPDYLIGRKLSQKYRFEESVKFLRQALKINTEYLPAKIHLAGDLLRLGQEKQGWALADEVHKTDAYNVHAYNLVNLHDNISKFKTLTDDGFIVRMDPLEADIYGRQALDLLKTAKDTLCKKYGLDLEDTVTVELFPNQQDFAVRTFGMPGVDGFLAVCFGKVITANSPHPSLPANWKATLWHEYCHVVTLTLTKNKMPRWLSEGISVYEERQQSPSWGQHMNPRYRTMILNGEMTPVGNLSSAFMSPPTPGHLQFAYFQSSLVVEFLVEKFGLDSLKAILADLEKGGDINEAIAKHTAPIDKIETQFDSFARNKAQDLAKGIDWTKPDFDNLPQNGPNAMNDWIKKHPDNFWALKLNANNLISAEKWSQAKEPLNKLISLYPDYTESGNPYTMLAVVHRNLDETEQEYKALTTLAEKTAADIETYERLMELGSQQKKWSDVATNADRYLAVYPMPAMVYRHRAEAMENLQQNETAIDSYKRVLLLDPADPAEINYRLAKLLLPTDRDAAKKHILESLAEAPRFRDGHKLLLEILEPPQKKTDDKPADIIKPEDSESSKETPPEVKKEDAQ